jgi:DNA primase
MDLKDTVKSQVNIVDVIGAHIRLKRSGAGPRYIGLCPFHVEKTPSFSVNADHQYYKCFGCQEAGDLFTFVQKTESLTFPEAVKALAERYGIPIPARAPSGDPAQQRRDELFEVVDKAAGFFEANLHGSHGDHARQYLEGRKVSMETARSFRLGFADPSGQQMLQRLKSYDQSILEEAGLVIRRDDGTIRDRFRQRIIFPIHNEQGRVIGFGGRALRPDDNPKYLNSPQTSLYNKSVVLYNLHRAKIAARKSDRMIVVEGYMDVIGVASAGISEVVAICGTALTNDQVRHIKRQIAHENARTGQVIINLDPDRAGVAATEKSIHLLLAEGLRVKVLALPGGLDPDEFIGQQGVERYQALCAAAPRYFSWLADRAKEKFDMTTAEGRVDAFRYLWPAIQTVHDRLERAEIANEIAESLNIDKDMVRERFGQKRSAAGPSRSPDLTLSLPPTERLLLNAMLQSAEARAHVLMYLTQIDKSEEINKVEMFTLVPAFDAFLTLEHEQVPFSLDNLLARVDGRVRAILEQLAFSETNTDSETSTMQALDCLRRLESKQVTSKGLEIKRRIQAAEKAGNFEEAMRLADELNKHQRASS